MKLYFSKGSCSLASHIALEEAGAKFEAQRINLREGEQKQPEYLKVNPKAKVPALALDGGTVHHREPGDHQLRRRHASAGEAARAAGRARRAPRRRSGWRGAPRRCIREFGPLFRDKDDAEQREVVAAESRSLRTSG